MSRSAKLESASNAYRRLGFLVCLVGSIWGSAGPAQAGPIAESYKRWSMQRQTQTHVEKPFSHQSSQVEMNSASMLHKLRSKLTLKPKTDTTQHQMTTTPIRLNQGNLYR